MMHFTYLASSNAPGNQLQRQVLVLLQGESNLLIEDKDAFLASLRKQIEKLNAENPRCTPLSFSTYGMGHTSIALGQHFTVGFHLYPVKNGGANA